MKSVAYRITTIMLRYGTTKEKFVVMLSAKLPIFDGLCTKICDVILLRDKYKYVIILGHHVIKAQEEGMMNFVPTRSSYLVPLLSSDSKTGFTNGKYSRAVLRV